MEKLNKMLLILLLLIFSLVMSSCASPPKTHYTPTPKKSSDVLKKMCLKSGEVIECDIMWEGVAGQICCKKSDDIIAYSAGDVDLIRTFGESSAAEIGQRYEERVKQRELRSKPIIVTPEQERWMKKQRLEDQKRSESQNGEAELTSLRDVDLVSISAYIKDGVLKVGIFYKNSNRDELVFWKTGTVSCSCEVYEMMGSPIDVKKGERIAKKNKQLKRFGQDFYIDIPKYTSA